MYYNHFIFHTNHQGEKGVLPEDVLSMGYFLLSDPDITRAAEERVHPFELIVFLYCLIGR